MMCARDLARARRMTLIKMFAAFCIGAAVLAGLQTAGVWSLQHYLKSEGAKAGLPRIGTSPNFATHFNASGLKGAILPKYGAIDTRNGQRRGVEAAARRVDLQIRAAQTAVPLPPRGIPGAPRR
jgi:hypothetical protein